jgi:hypothetical protein
MQNQITDSGRAIINGKATGLAGCSQAAGCDRASTCMRADSRLTAHRAPMRQHDEKHCTKHMPWTARSER